MNKEGDNVVRVNFEGGFATKNIDDLSPQDMILCEQKQTCFTQWVQKGTVCLLLDARKPNVKVPANFKHQGDLRLNFCYQFHIPDFGFNQRTIWATLSFPQGTFFCQVPWTAVYGMQAVPLNQGRIWFADFPADLDQEAVLGFREEDCLEAPDEIPPEPSEPPEKCNVISIESLRKKNIVDDRC